MMRSSGSRLCVDARSPSTRQRHEETAMPSTAKRGPGHTRASVDSSAPAIPPGRVAPADRVGQRTLGSDGSPWSGLLLGAVVLIAVLGTVLVTYWPALSAGALYMDDKFYLGNPVVQHPSWTSVGRIFGEVLSPSLVNGYYQPISLLSFMLDFLDPAAAGSLLPFHRTTLLLHLLNVVLVVVLLYVLLGSWITANVLGLLYGVHPLNADAVLWIAERKTVLSTFFALSALLLYVAYARHADGNGRRDWKRYIGSLFLYACALLSKPTALPVVALLLVLDYWPLKRLSRRTLLEKLPFLLVAGLAAVIAVISQARAGQNGTVQFMKLHSLPLVVAYSVGLYLLKVVHPTGLVSDYRHPQPWGLANMEVLGCAMITLGVVAAIALTRRRTRAWLAGGLWFLLAVAPTLGLIRFTSSVAANRSMYLPMVGLLLPLHWELSRLWQRGVGGVKTSMVRALPVFMVVVLAAGSGWATRRYESHWHDSLTLLQYYLVQQPNDLMLHTRLGNEWIQRREYRAAIAEFRKAVSCNPSWTENHLNLGRALFTVGEYEQAKQAFAVALQQTPKDWRAHMLMGNVLERQGDLQGTLDEFRAASRLAPSAAVAHFNTGRILEQQEKWSQAAREYEETLRLEPRFSEARRALDAIRTRADDEPRP